jgi:hypothetical protein
VSITALRSAVTTAGGTPTQYTHVGLLRQLITAWGGTPTQWSINGLLTEAVTKAGGTSTKHEPVGLLRELITTLGGNAVSFIQDTLWAQLATVSAAGIGGMVAPVLTQTSTAGTNPPEWDSDFTNYQTWDGVDTGDKQLMRWRRVNGGAWTTEAEQGLDDELIMGGFTWPLYEAAKPLAAGYFEAQEQRARYAAGVEIARSAWSTAGQVVDTLSALSWDPSQVSGIKDYFKASLTSCFKDTACTIPVTADGDAVLGWKGELSVITFSQGTAGRQPIYKTNSGNPYVLFDGVDDRIGSNNITLAQPAYIMVATKPNAMVTSQVVLDGSTSGNSLSVRQKNVGAPDYEWNLYAGTAVNSQGAAASAVDVVIGGLFNGASSKPRLDQTDGSTVNVGAQAYAASGVRIGGDVTPANFYAGRVYGMVFVGASPSAGDKTAISTWLGALQGRTI